MEITGFMLNRSEERRISETFQTMDFYADCGEYDRRTGQKYENVLKFQVSNANIDRLDSIKKGDLIKISFQPRGVVYEKEGEKRHFQTLNAWRIELVEHKQNNVQNNALAPQVTQPATAPSVDEEDDDLPF